ncbi:hypothetical protein [Sandaracinobacter neustonicus]|uniref:hypothetical protein n=1 Tax=Sandaracinobacter neustonicus TaxID=1715348 RepID=UPI0015E276A2|nr:hypothetical protein [Sandaracinobacter neustonicus]
MPFLLFAIVCHAWGPLSGLAAGALSAIALVGHQLAGGRSAKILEVGTALLFGGLAVYTLISGAQWSVMGVRLTVDIGIFLIVAGSIIVGRPFTMQYAQETVAPEYWDSFAFREINRKISLVWAMAMAAIMVADALLLFMPQLPHALAIGMTVAALAGAASYTKLKTS